MKEHLVKLLICILSLTFLVLLVVLPNKQTAPAPTPEPDTDQVQASDTPEISPADREGKLVGICLPAQSGEWTDATMLLKEQLEEKGYDVTLAYGNGTAEGQTAAMNSLRLQKADCLIVAPVDSAALPDQQDKAEDATPILCYGSLLMDTANVAGYVCYDYFGMGAAIAVHIENALGLKTAYDEDRSYTTELFMGASRNYNAILLHQGLRSVLDPYFETGVLEVLSGRLEFEDCSIAGWSAESAAKACATRLANHYPDRLPNICIGASDNIAAGVIQALEEVATPDSNRPLVTGNGATEEGLAFLEQGKLFLTVLTDPADPAKACAEMVDMVLFDTKPDFPVTQTFNHVIDVPTALCDFRVMGE